MKRIEEITNLEQVHERLCDILAGGVYYNSEFENYKTIVTAERRNMSNELKTMDHSNSDRLKYLVSRLQLAREADYIINRLTNINEPGQRYFDLVDFDD